MKEESAYQTISETSKLIDVPTHVLRFWEKKFSILKPKKGAGGRRYYSKEDIDNLHLIKNLLYEKGYTINGAKMYLNTDSKDSREYLDDNLKITEKLEDALFSLKKIKNIITNY